MQFFTAAIAAAILASSSAAPTGTLFTREHHNIVALAPKVISNYEVSTGAVLFNLESGKIFKSTAQPPASDISTLLTLTIPSESAGLTCSFTFYSVGAAGSFNVFSSIAPATQDTTTWPSGNLRDQDMGRVTMNTDSNAVVDASLPIEQQAPLTFPCPAGKTLGLELVGAGDNVDIEWLQGTTGAVGVAYQLW